MRQLIEAMELAALGDDCIVVDCRFDLSRPLAGEEAYRAGHVPGAWYAHLDRDLSSPRTAMSGRHPLPSPGTIQQLLRRWGAAPRIPIVVYDDAGGAIAARLWWLLRWIGHDDVALLDGGWQAWVAAGLPVGVGNPVSGGGQSGMAGYGGGCMPVIGADEIERRLADRSLLLLDVRARSRFLGEAEPIDPVAGHVPGALNHPFHNHLSESGRFRPPEAIAAEYGRILQGRPVNEVAVMCGSGVTACHGLFALELAGMPGASLYAGSWSEWISGGHRPVARA